MIWNLFAVFGIVCFLGILALVVIAFVLSDKEKDSKRK